MIYTLLRLLLFVAATGLLWWVGMRSWLAPVLGVLVAWMLSYVLLGRWRARAARYMQARGEARTAAPRATRADEDAAVEDAADEAARRAPDTDG